MAGHGMFGAWIGARDLLDMDEYRFVSNAQEISTELWLPDEPNDGAGDCVFISSGRLMVDNCGVQNPYVCEFYP